MATPSPAEFRTQLLERRKRLEPVAEAGGPEYLADLLHEVDAALARIDSGGYGVCEDCRGEIEEDRLRADPLARLCLDCLSPEQRRALEYDLELARRIQAGLLPAREASLSGWAVSYHYGPLGAVSGDYCDLIPGGSPGQALFVLGDVAGKGIAASLLMANLNAIFRSLDGAGLGLSDLLEQANRLFCSATAGSFATLVAGRTASSGEVEIANAGHCPPLLRRGDGVTSLPATGLPIGLFRSGRCTTHCLRLEPGDALLLYSDGLSEAGNPAGEEYGTARLGRVLERGRGFAPPALVRTVLDDLAVFQAGTPPSDDLTIMVVQKA